MCVVKETAHVCVRWRWWWRGTRAWQRGFGYGLGSLTAVPGVSWKGLAFVIRVRVIVVDPTMYEAENDRERPEERVVADCTLKRDSEEQCPNLNGPHQRSTTTTGGWRFGCVEMGN